MPGILFDIAANIVSLQQDFNKAHGEINKFAKAAQQTFDHLKNIAITAGIGFGLTEGIKKSFDAVDKYNQAVAAMAAMVTTFAERQKNQDLAGQWQQALKYSSAMVPILENISAKTLLSGVETTALANAWARQGVFLNAANEKQIEGFRRLSNALPLLTQGQEIMRQINTEIRSVMTGQSEVSSMLLQTLKAIDPEIEKNLATWRNQGTVMEHIGELLAGFGPATSLLEKQWLAIKTTLDTTVTQILRAGFRDAYNEIIKSALDLNRLLNEQKNIIAHGMVMAWESIKDIVGSVINLIRPFTPLLTEIADIMAKIAYGWGALLAILKPITALFGNIASAAWELGKAAYFSAQGIWALATVQIDNAKYAREQVRKSLEEIKRLSKESSDIAILENIEKAIMAYDKRANTAIASLGKESDAAMAFKAKQIADIEAVKKAEEALNNQRIKDFKAMVDAMNDFERDYYKAVKTITDVDTRELQIRYNRYKEFVKDEVRLEEWLAAEKRNILIKSNNERIALFEELYKSSKQQEFADQALKAMQEVLDIEEKKWADILKNDQWAHDLRLQREREYIDKLKAMIPEVVDAWAGAQEKIVYEYSLPKYLEQGGQASSEGIVSGFPVGPGSGGPMIGQNNYSGLLDQIATNTKNIAEDANRTAQMQAEEAQREQQRLMEERQRAFQVGYSRFQAFAQTRERATWGGVEWATEFERLGKSFTETTDYQKSLQLLDDMLSALEQIESIEKVAISQNETLQKNLAQSNESISKWLSSLEASGAAPVQSSASLALQFEEYKKKALGDLQYVNEFLSIASQYLSFEKTFGSTESYKSVYDAVVKSVKAVQEQHKLYEDFSALGLGNTISELKLLKDGFEILGISTAELKKAAEAARLSTDKSSSAILTFSNTQGTASSVTGNATDNMKKTMSALYYAMLSASLSTDGFTGKVKLVPDAVSMALGDKGLAKLTDSLINSLPKSITTAVGSTGLSSLYTYIAGWIPAAVSAATTEENGIQKVKKELGENLPASIKTLLGPENTKALIDELANNLPKSVKDAVGLSEDTGLQKLFKALGITGDTAEESSPKLTTVSGSLAAMTLNIQTKLSEIGAFFDTLATKMNINLNPTSAEQAIKNLTPAALWQAVTTQVAAYWVNIRTGIQSTFQGYPSQDWNYVPAQTATRLFNPSTGEWKGKGGLTSGLAVAGEIGPEWVVPTYEPQRSAFLQSVGVDSAEIGKQIAAQFGGGQPVHVHIEVDGREIAYAVVRQARSNADIADGFRRLS